jgi:hypothetical protein
MFCHITLQHTLGESITHLTEFCNILVGMKSVFSQKFNMNHQKSFTMIYWIQFPIIECVQDICHQSPVHIAKRGTICAQTTGQGISLSLDCSIFDHAYPVVIVGLQGLSISQPLWWTETLMQNLGYFVYLWHWSKIISTQTT